MRAGGVKEAANVLKKAFNIGIVDNLYHIADWYYIIRDNSNGLSGKWLIVQTFLDGLIIVGGFLLLVFVGIKHEEGILIRNEISKKPVAIRWAILMSALFLIILFGIYGPEYNVSDFIYKEF